MPQRLTVGVAVLVLVAFLAGLTTGAAVDRLIARHDVSLVYLYDAPSGQGGYVADTCSLEVPGHDVFVQVGAGCALVLDKLAYDGFEYTPDQRIPAGDRLICGLAEPTGAWAAHVFDSGGEYYGSLACATLRGMGGE